MTFTPKPTTKSMLGRLLFRWRSYLPLIAVAGLIYGLYIFGPTSSGLFGLTASGNLRWAVGSGLVLAALGLTLRVYAVGHAPAGTSGRHRRQHAARLNTFGIYSVVRHPLYVGNVLVWAGVSLTSGWLPGAAASTLGGILMFGLIVRHEDGFLARTFGSDFEEWARVTPATVPRPSLWRPSRRPFRWAKTVASEYSTLHSIGLVALLFAALRGIRAPGSWNAGRGWWGLLALNSALYLGLRVWRSRRKRRIASSAP